MSETCCVELEYLIGRCGGGKSNGNNQRRCTGRRCIGGNRVERTEWRTCQQKRGERLVEASIEKLGYQVNTLAKGMRMQKTDYVVVILPNLINPYFALLLDALESELSAVGKTGTTMPVR